LIFFFPSYNYFLICVTRHFWQSEKENLFHVSCHWGIICVFGLFLNLNRRPNNNKIIITVVSDAAIFVVMNIIIKARRGSGVHNARRRKLPRVSSLKNKLLYIHFFRDARSLESDCRKCSMRHQDF
jgi:hypothetical protein